MAAAGDDFYRDVARAGYRGPYLRAIAAAVADGSLDLEELDGRSDLPDEEVEARLLALPGVGPYAAAHVMMLLGRYRRLILDSWTRPKWARMRSGRRKPVEDRAIERRFRRYGDFAGLAFWLYLTEGLGRGLTDPELVERGEQLGRVAVDAVGAGALELVGAVAAGQQADAEHARAARREQVPDGVADHVAVARLDGEAARALDEQVRLRLGARDVAALDDDRLGRRRRAPRARRRSPAAGPRSRSRA